MLSVFRDALFKKIIANFQKTCSNFISIRTSLLFEFYFCSYFISLRISFLFEFHLCSNFISLRISSKQQTQKYANVGSISSFCISEASMQFSARRCLATTLSSESSGNWPFLGAKSLTRGLRVRWCASSWDQRSVSREGVLLASVETIVAATARPSLFFARQQGLHSSARNPAGMLFDAGVGDLTHSVCLRQMYHVRKRRSGSLSKRSSVSHARHGPRR